MLHNGSGMVSRKIIFKHLKLSIMKNLLGQKISKKSLMGTTSIQSLASKTGISENTISIFVSELNNNGEMNQQNLVNRLCEHLKMFDI